MSKYKTFLVSKKKKIKFFFFKVEKKKKQHVVNPTSSWELKKKV